MAKTEVFIFRHGETDWNKEFKFQGHTDIPLNEAGKIQALGLAAKLEKLRPQIILTSDLKRAKLTAQIANQNLNLNIIESDQLRECNLGDLEGLHREVVVQKYGDLWERWQSRRVDDVDFGFPNGETKRQHLNRIINYLEDFFHTHPHYNQVAVSTHGASLRRLVHHCDGSPAEAVPMPNCVLYKISYHRLDKQWKFHGLVDELADLR